MVHTIFFQMCGVEESACKVKHTNDLCTVALLEIGAPFEIIENREVWHPMWKEKIDNKVNTQFIKKATDRIWDNKQVSIYIFLSSCVLIFYIEDSGCL